MTHRDPWNMRGLLLVWAALAAGMASAADPGEPADRVGKLFRVSLPITGSTTDTVRQSVLKVLDTLKDQPVRPVLIFEFTVAKGQREFGRGGNVGNAYALADFLSSDAVSGATTVAYVPASIQGHGVLPVLACDIVVMAPDADLGPAGIDEARIASAILENYKSIANRRKNFPAEVAMKLVDASRELLEVRTEQGVAEYTTPADLKEIEKRRTISSKKVLFRAGEAARFSGTEARNKGFVQHLAANRLELARVLDLPPESLTEDSPFEGQWRAVRIELRGPINADAIDRAERMIRDALSRHEANFICLWIDSAGGSPADSLRLATYLAGLDPGQVRTVAYIPREARADAALLAFGCDQTVMHPNAVLGGEGDHNFPPDEIRDITETLRKEIAVKKTRSWSLTAAMIDPELAVHRYRKGAESGFFSDAELNEQPNAEQWKKGDPVTTPGRPFSAKGSEAVELRLAAREVHDFAEFRQMYALENDPALLEPSWADILIEALGKPGVAVLLLVIGGVALYAELHSPGMGVGGFVATVCFVLFFWSRFLGGTAGWLEVALFGVGAACLLLEIFVIPGFGVFGLGGGVLIIASLVLASQTFVLPHNEYQAIEFRNSLMTIVAAGAGTLAVVVLFNRWLPHTPLLGQMILRPPTQDEVVQTDERDELQALVGTRGVAVTPLLPCGKVRLGQSLMDVMTLGEFVNRGAEVVVIEAKPNRIVVRPSENA